MLHVELTSRGQVLYEVLNGTPTNMDDSFGNDTLDWFYTILDRVGECDPILVGSRDPRACALTIGNVVPFELVEYDASSEADNATVVTVTREALLMFKLNLLRAVE